jgi:hypothetical protein
MSSLKRAYGKGGTVGVSGRRRRAVQLLVEPEKGFETLPMGVTYGFLALEVRRSILWFKAQT